MQHGLPVVGGHTPTCTQAAYWEPVNCLSIVCSVTVCIGQGLDYASMRYSRAGSAFVRSAEIHDLASSPHQPQVLVPLSPKSLETSEEVNYLFKTVAVSSP